MDRAKLEKFLIKHEGYRKEPYKDTEGYWTVGYGHFIHTLKLNAFHNFADLMGDLCDPEKHQMWLQHDMDQAETLVKNWLEFTYNQMSGERQVAICAMAFQLGRRLLKFEKLRSALHSHNWRLAKKEMLDSLWHEQTPRRCEETAELMWREE